MELQQVIDVTKELGTPNRPQGQKVHPEANCFECPLFGQPYALSDGPDDADLMVVSRSPAHGDTVVGKPFSGPSGKLLNHLLEMHGGERRSTYVTNVVLCRSDKPSDEAIACCAPRLESELRRVRPSRIIAAGSEAVKIFAPGATVKSARGKRIQHQHGRTVVATFNPAAALRDDVVYPDLVSDFKRALVDPKPFNPPHVTWTEDANEAYDLLGRVNTGTRSNMGIVAADIETTGLHATSGLLSVGFCYEPGTAVVFGRGAVSDYGFRRELRDFFSSEDIRFIWHNGKFDVKVLREHGYPARVDDDTLLLSYLLDERPGVHSLDYMVADVLDWPAYEPDSVKQGKKNGFSDFDDWPALYNYNGYDCVGSFRIHQELWPKVQDEKLDGVYRDLLIPASNVFADVERYGVLFDVEKAKDVRDNEILPLIAEHNFKAQCIVGRDINLNSPKQVAHYIYEEKGIRDPKVNRKVDLSSDKATRKYLLETTTDANVREFLEALGEFKRLDKIRGTYLDGLIEKVDSDGRIKCDFLLHGTESGRTSSRRPNLQNQPRGRLIRQLYIAPPGSVIMQADYSQCELRTMAMISGDEAMKQIYRDGRDFHSETAAHHYGEDFTSEQRVLAKNINFGIGYWQSAYSFSEMYGIPIKEAEAYVNSWREQFSTYVAWSKSVHGQILDTGELRSMFGRKRRFHLITNQNKDHALKEGSNFVIQSPASDFHLHAAIMLHSMLKGMAHILIIVHDSIVLEVINKYVDLVQEKVREVMEGIPAMKLNWTDIPFKVDIGVGPSWGEVE